MRIFSKRRAGLIGLSVGAVFALSAAAYAAVTWGPNRTTYTWAHPANKITFNSITDNPVWGDERYLIKARNINESTANYATTKSVSDNQEYLVTLYFHNNADSGLNLTATGVKAKFSLPFNAATTAQVRGDISADNSDPLNVFSTMDFTSANGQPFTLEYVPNSARLKTNYVDMALPDAVAYTGTTIGTSGTDGQVQGCAQFSGYVTIHVKVHQPNPAYRCDALNVTTSANRKVNASISYTATGGATYKSTTITWGDGLQDTFNGTTAGHTYAKDGNYTINATLKFDVGGTEQTAVCSKQVSFNTPVPPTPGKLPNTGAGSTAAIFAGVSALAGLGHYFVTGRRFGRQ